MSRKTGLRLLAALCYLSLVGFPLGLLLHYVAIKAENKEEKQEQEKLERLEEIAENVDQG